MNTILVINKDPKIFTVIEKLILKTYQGFQVLTSFTGKEGIELAIKKDPCIIILDTILPEKDSNEICICLKKEELTKDIPVIFLMPITAVRKIRIEAIEAGADAFLSKPVDDLELALLINAMLKIKRAAVSCRNEKFELKKLVEQGTTEYKIELDKRIKTEEALRESEQRYRLLVENQNDLVVKFNHDQKMVYVNPNYCKTFGLNEEDILGKPFFPLIHKNDLEIVKNAINSLSVPPHKNYHEERDKTVNGWRWFGWSKNAAVDKNGKISEVVAVGRDINDRKEIEQTLKENEAKLRELNATKDKFFSIIAHDLRSPFNGILGFSELIVEKSKNNDYSGMCMMSSLLHESAKHSFDLLTNLLEWSRTQRGRKSFEPVTNQLISILQGEINVTSLMAREKNIDVKYNCPEIVVFADFNMLQTILRNLIFNAIKYTFSGGEIIINVQQNEKEILISVKDNGIGMSDEKQNKLFKIGEMESTPGTNNEKGTGLGLILCKEFIELHGGRIWVESEKGNGAIFYFTLPDK